MKEILIIDDDIHIGNMLDEVLTKENYTVLRAYSGTEAILLLPTKPFNIKELLARIIVQLRKQSIISNDILVFEDLILNTNTHTVNVNDIEIKLTRTEYAILKLLMQNSSQVVTKSLILDSITEDTPDCTESSLKIHVSNLRKKLRNETDKDYIESVWGIGFKLKE